MSKHVCVICYTSLPRAQRTCGSDACIDAWKNIRSQSARTKRINLATVTPSERALIEAQEVEPQPDPGFLDNLQAAAAAEQSAKGPGPSLRDLLNPDNFKPKGGDEP